MINMTHGGRSYYGAYYGDDHEFSLERQKILAALNAADSNFYTGSRYFKSQEESNDSDYDFFAGNEGPHMVHFLLELGFKYHRSPLMGYDGDPNTAVVLRHPCGVDVQLVVDIPAKIFCQKLLKTMGLLLDAQKDDVYDYWKKAFLFYNALPQLP